MKKDSSAWKKRPSPKVVPRVARVGGYRKTEGEGLNLPAMTLPGCRQREDVCNVG